MKDQQPNLLISKGKETMVSAEFAVPKMIEWVGCDICYVSGHSTCAKNEESHWKNIRRKSWLCNVHNV